MLVGFEIHDSGGFNKNYHRVTEDESFVLDGLPYARSIRPEKNWAEQVRALWTDDDSLLSEVFGTWAVARYSEQAGGRVLSDFTGMTPVFYWHCGDYLGVSTRQMLLAGLLGRMELDPFGISWLTGQANLIGEVTPWRGVSHLPPQHNLEFNGRRGDLSFRIAAREIWRRDPSDSVSLDQAVESLIEQSRVISALPLGDLKLDITGGLDSRLVLAIALTSGLAQKCETLQTSGPPNGHDIQVGRAVAQLTGLPHKENVVAENRCDPGNVLDEIRANVFRYEGSICPSDGFAAFSSGNSRLILSGSGGEIYRRNCKPHLKLVLKDSAELLEVFKDYHQRTDPLGIQQAAVTAAQRAEMIALARDLWCDGAELNDITDIFYMRYRLPLWNGAMMNNIYSGVRLYPLVNYHVARLAFRMGFRARVSDQIHFEAMLRLSPELLSFPFLGFVWPEPFRASAADRGVHVADKPFPVQGSSIARMPPQIQALMGEGWKLVEEYVLDAPSSELWEILDRGQIERVFSDRQGECRGIVPAKQIFSVLALRVLCSGDFIHRREQGGHPLNLDGAHASELFSNALD